MTVNTTDWDLAFQNPLQRFELNVDGANEIKGLLNKKAATQIELAIACAVLHKLGRQSSGKGMTKNWTRWWQANGLEKAMGKKSFYRYSSVGTFLLDLKNNNRFRKHIEDLPTSLDGIKACMELSEAQFEMCLKDHYIRDTNAADAKKRPKKEGKASPVINRNATAQSIRAWQQRWDNPPVKKTDFRDRNVFVIKINRQKLLEANADASAPANPELLRKAQQLQADLEKVLSNYDLKNDFLLENNVAKLSEQQEKAIATALKKTQK